MPQGQQSGSGRFLLLVAALRTVLTQAAEGSGKLWEEDKQQASVDRLWMSADTISLSILPLNLSDHRIQVSVRQENDTTMVMVDTLPVQVTASQSTATPLKYKVKELLPDTKYEVCVALSEQGNSDFFSNATKSECYKVRTFPKVDNLRGVYTALASVGVFLLASGMTWLIYKVFWSKYYTKVFPVQDSHEEEQPVEGQSVSTSGQEINVEQPEDGQSGPTSTQDSTISHNESIITTAQVI